MAKSWDDLKEEMGGTGYIERLPEVFMPKPLPI